MKARTLGVTIVTWALVAAVPVMSATSATPLAPPANGFAVERGQVTALAGTGLQFQPHALVAPTPPQPGYGAAMYSDARLKTDIFSMTNALATIQNLRGVTFRWNQSMITDRTVPAGRQLGFIAQETQKVLPEVVTTDEHGYLAVQYSNVVPVLVEAIKEQQIQLDAKDAAIEKIRSDADTAVKDLQTRLADVEDALTRLSANGGTAPTQHGYVQIAPGVFRQY